MSAADPGRPGPLPEPPAGATGWPWTTTAPSPPSTMPDGSPWPRITIVTPSYNQAQWVEATIRSVLLQGYPELQYVVVDGASTDGSVDIIRTYGPWLDDWRSEPDEGQPDAINKGLALASGEILGWLNSDDLLLPGALVRVALLARRRPDAVAWVGGCHRIDTAGRITDTILPRGLDRASLADWGFDGFFYQPSCFFAASAWDRVGALDQRLEYGFDIDLWLKLADLGPFAATDDILSAALFHEQAKSGQGRLGQHADTIALQVYHGYLDAAMRRLDHLMERRRVRHLVRLAVRTRLRGLIERMAFWRRDPLPLLADVLDAMPAPHAADAADAVDAADAADAAGAASEMAVPPPAEKGRR